jgi:MoaA/NifB/PqqE/SkfB family radical SAM enzyme
MQRIDIKVTFKCNNSCKFCVQGDKRKFYFDKTDDEIKIILKDAKISYDEVVFTGGEPTIRPGIMDLVSYAKNLGYKIQVQTNGRIFAYRDFCKEIIKAGANVFAISIHGHNAKLHDFLTSAKGSFEQSRSGIKNLLSFGELVITNTVINKINYRFLPEIARFLIDLGIPQYQFAFPHILGKALTDADWIIPRKKDILPYLNKGIEIGVKKKKVVRVEAVPYCFLKEHEDCISDRYILDIKVFDINTTNNFNRWRREEGKIKGPKCRGCKYFSCCEGPWREYPEIFGWDEFIPIK